MICPLTNHWMREYHWMWEGIYKCHSHSVHGILWQPSRGDFIFQVIQNRRVGHLHLQHCNDICGTQRVVSWVVVFLGTHLWFIAHTSDLSELPVIVGSEDLVHFYGLRAPEWQMLKKKVCRWLYVLYRFSSCLYILF